MSLYAIIYMISMLSIFLGERFIGGDSLLRYTFDTIGLLALGLAFFLANKDRGKAPTDRKGIFTLPLIYMAIGTLSLLVYSLSLETIVNGFDLEPESEHKYLVFIKSLWPIIWMVGTFPLIGLASLFGQSHAHLNIHRARKRASIWLGSAFALSALFPLNYIAHDTNEKWDLGFFKTPNPGTSTLSLVESLSSPMSAYLFFPTSSNVREEVRSYFAQINNPNFSVTFVDWDAEGIPEELRDKLQPQDVNKGNGYILLYKHSEQTEDDSSPKLKPKNTKFIQIGKTLDKAKVKLKSLDEKVREGILSLTRERGVIYFTQGHGELHWKSSGKSHPMTKISSLKKLLRDERFKVEELGLADGLANGVPDDAKLVMIMGPTSDFFEAEIEALQEYRQRGGALMINLEPTPNGTNLKPLLSPLGLEFDNNAVLLHENIIYSTSGAKNSIKDRVNLVSNNYSTHASISNVSANKDRYPILLSSVGKLTKKKDSKAKTTLRSMEKTWAEQIVRGMDLQFSETNNETKQIWDIAVAITEKFEVQTVVATENKTEDPVTTDPTAETSDPEGTSQETTAQPAVITETKESRVIVFADSTWATDQLLAGRLGGAMEPPNTVAFRDMLSWLVKDPAISGTVENTKDKKIQHSKEGQGWVFYGTVVLFPVMTFLLGLLLVRRRKIKSQGDA